MSNWKRLLFLLFSISSVSPSNDIDIVRERRYSEIVGVATGAKNIPAWVSSLGPDGKWPGSEVDYTTGCDASTSSWPIQEHWERINTFAAAYHGGFKNALNYSGDPDLRARISLAMNFWFENDFEVPECLSQGGTDTCPCDTPGLWNENWFENVILIPAWVAQVCLLLGSTLTSSELANCTRIGQRTYNTFTTGIVGVSNITGANLLGIASVGIDLGLLTSNLSLIDDGFARVHGEVTFKDGVKADGIRPDGSFGQHAGLLYNGNYGRDYQNNVFNLEIAAGGTQYQANSSSMSAFSTLIDADLWMSFFNTLTGVAHWDYSVIGRYIALSVADNQSSASLKTNFTQIEVLGQEWQSEEILNVFDAWTSTPADANIGRLQGSQMFYTNDYMVNRGPGYVSTLKMYSKRTQNSECVNNQNPFGFHLADGALYTYLTGNEYEDVFPAWDWNLIPGTTVDYNGTSLNCTGIRHTGTQAFVGGTSDGKISIAAMRYETPSSKALNWRKTWFFLEDDVQFVMVARLTSTNLVPVFSVLDQRKHVGDVYVSGVQSSTGNYTAASSLWHGGVGYTFNSSNPAVSLSIQLGTRSGSWLSLGSKDTTPETVDIFAAWLNHTDLTVPISYGIYPATSTLAAFQAKVNDSQLESIRNDGTISALLDVTHATAMIAYWETAGGSVTIPPTTPGDATVTVQSTGNSLVIVRMAVWTITVADPTQTLATVTLTLTLGSGSIPDGWTGTLKSKSIIITLPQNGLLGQSVTQSLN